MRTTKQRTVSTVALKSTVIVEKAGTLVPSVLRRARDAAVQHRPLGRVIEVAVPGRRGPAVVRDVGPAQEPPLREAVRGRRAEPMLVKKYPNRRLYDTLESRYITLEELAEKIRAGADARVIDAKTDEDLTQQTLTQIILESRNAARLLPVPLLVQLVRMGDDALAEFFSRYVAWALEVYLATKQNALGFAGLGALLGTAPLRWLERSDRGERLRPPWEEKAAVDTAEIPRDHASSAPPEVAVAEVVPPTAGVLGLGEDVAALRRELDALKRTLRRKR